LTNPVLLFFDEPAIGAPLGVLFAVVFFLILAGAAFIAYKMLRKTVKMAFRMTIVAVILLIALAGSITLWWYGSTSPSTRQERAPSRSR
jgi:phosphoglycerol transferase MdoB-like AlkP superfamily enzyme